MASLTHCRGFVHPGASLGFGDERVSWSPRSLGWRDRIRLVTDAQTDESYATLRIARSSSRAHESAGAPTGCECRECHVVGTEDRLKALREDSLCQVANSPAAAQSLPPLAVTAGAVSRRPARFRPPLGPWALLDIDPSALRPDCRSPAIHIKADRSRQQARFAVDVEPERVLRNAGGASVVVTFRTRTGPLRQYTAVVSAPAAERANGDRAPPSRLRRRSSAARRRAG